MKQTPSRQYALYLSLRYTRAVVNTSFVILTVILIIFGYKNPAGVFTLIFYNGLYYALYSSYKNKKKYREIRLPIPDSLKDFLPHSIDTAEQTANQLCLPVSVVLHLLLAFGFQYRMSLKIEQMKAFPLIMLSFVLITRYLSYYLLKRYISKKMG